MDRLYADIRHRYDVVYRNIPIYSKKSQRCEIDLLGIKGNCLDIYEVKCSFRKTKATKQLARIKRSFYGDWKVRTFFYCGSASTLVKIEC